MESYYPSLFPLPCLVCEISLSINLCLEYTDYVIEGSQFPLWTCVKEYCSSPFYNIWGIKRANSFTSECHDVPVSVVMMPLPTPNLLFDCSRRTPKCPSRIDPIRIELQHLLVELLCGRRHYGHSVEIAYVLAGLLDDTGIVLIIRSLMWGDNCMWIERLDFVECSDPFLATLRIWLN